MGDVVESTLLCVCYPKDPMWNRVKFNQIGFRKGYRKAGHVFVKQTLIENYESIWKKPSFALLILRSLIIEFGGMDPFTC